MTKFYGLTKEDIEMIKSRHTRAKYSSLNPIIRIKTIPARKKGFVKEIQFELMEEIVVFEAVDYESNDEMFNTILMFLNSIKVY